MVNNFWMDTVIQKFFTPKLLLTYGISFPLYIIDGTSHGLSVQQGFCSNSLRKILLFVHLMTLYVRRWLSFDVLLNDWCTHHCFMPFPSVYTSDLATFLGTDATASQPLQHPPHCCRACAPQRLFFQACNPTLSCREIRFGHEYI